MCLCPVYVPNPSYFANDVARHGIGDGVYDDVIVGHYENNSSAYIAAPCRHCIECVKARSAEWSARLRSELDYEMNVLGHDCYFVTLTIDPVYMSEFMSFGKVDKSKCSRVLGSFFRSLKDAYRKVFRHFCIAEYGERRGRLHFHCLFFNPPVSLETDGVHRHFSKNGVLMGSSPVLRRFWKYGFNDSGKVGSIAAGCYVSKYLTKSLGDSLTLPPIIVSRNVGKNDQTIKNSKEVLRKTLETGYYSVPIVFGRHQQQYQIPYAWMRKEHLSDLADEFGLSVHVADLIIRYAMADSYDRDSTPGQRRAYYEYILNRRIRYISPLDIRERRMISLLEKDFLVDDFIYNMEFDPF